MRKHTHIFCFLLVVAIILFVAEPLSSQTPQPDSDQTAPAHDNTKLPTGAAFVATRYSRRVKITADHKEQFLDNEEYPFKIARDAEGRLRLENIDPLPECDHPQQPDPPVCPVWGVIIFDPNAGTIAHWTDGEVGTRVPVIIPLSQSQIQQIEESTADYPEYVAPPDSNEGDVRHESLGEKDIDGIRAVGSRTTTTLAAGSYGNMTAIVRIHEVWWSPTIKRIVRVIDGDPAGEEVISGLKEISLSPKASLFQIPHDYKVQRWTEDELQRLASQGIENFAKKDIPLLAERFGKE